jgi:hypothetical protein
MPEGLKGLMFVLVGYSVIATAVAIRHTAVFAPPAERRRWILPVVILAAVTLVFPAIVGALSGVVGGSEATSLTVVYSVFAVGFLSAAVLSTRLIRRYPSR